jgi:hypothetical protein
VRNRRGADIGSDHHLMIANFKFKILAAGKKNEIRRNIMHKNFKYQVSKKVWMKRPV